MICTNMQMHNENPLSLLLYVRMYECKLHKVVCDLRVQHGPRDAFYSMQLVSGISLH